MHNYEHHSLSYLHSLYIIHAPVHTAPMVGCYSDAGCTMSVGSPVPDGATCCALHGNSVFHDEGGSCTACSSCKYNNTDI